MVFCIYVDIWAENEGIFKLRLKEKLILIAKLIFYFLLLVFLFFIRAFISFWSP